MTSPSIVKVIFGTSFVFSRGAGYSPMSVETGLTKHLQSWPDKLAILITVNKSFLYFVFTES